MMKWCLLGVMFLAGVDAAAAPGRSEGPRPRGAPEGAGLERKAFSKSPRNQRAFRIDHIAAARLVKAEYAARRVLGLRIVSGRQGPAYRVKTLSEQGVVKFVYVDAQTGDLSD